jgi:hypothetical protein
MSRFTWPAVLVGTVTGWSLRRTKDGVELWDQGGLWARAHLELEPEWVSAAVSLGGALVLYSPWLGVRIPPNHRGEYTVEQRREELVGARKRGLVAIAFVAASVRPGNQGLRGRGARALALTPRPLLPRPGYDSAPARRSLLQIGWRRRWTARPTTPWPRSSRAAHDPTVATPALPAIDAPMPVERPGSPPWSLLQAAHHRHRHLPASRITCQCGRPASRDRSGRRTCSRHQLCEQARSSLPTTGRRPRAVLQRAIVFRPG